jgi:hypothetical protein
MNRRIIAGIIAAAVLLVILAASVVQASHGRPPHPTHTPTRAIWMTATYNANLTQTALAATSTNTPAPPPATNTPPPVATNTPPPAATNTSVPVATDTPTNTATLVPTATNTPAPPPDTSGPTLVQAYWIQGDYQKMKYQPRQWQDGFFAYDASWEGWNITAASVGIGCDFHTSLNEGQLRASTSPQTHEFLLSRPSKVFIIGREPVVNLPSWMTALPRVGTVGAFAPTRGFTGNFPVFEANVPAGNVFFGGAWSAGSTPTAGRNMPWFVFCEADGSPTAAPALAIAPNTACPASLHDQWMTADGYRTWHPQIDPVYWCYYGHDHGTDPKHFDSDPPRFEYVALKMGGTEGHVGFKVYVMTTQDGLYKFRIVHHFGTSSQARACARFHTFEIKVRRVSDNALVADLKFMADFGQSENVDTHYVFQPSNCPTQGQTGGSTGARMMPVAPNGTAYEPWRIDPPELLGVAGTIGINTADQITFCADANCSSVIVRGTFSGTERFVAGDISIRHITGRPESFCTDPMAMAVIACTEANAIPQFVATGLVMDSRLTDTETECVEVRQWGYPLTCGQERTYPAEKENSVPTGGPN